MGQKKSNYPSAPPPLDPTVKPCPLCSDPATSSWVFTDCDPAKHADYCGAKTKTAPGRLCPNVKGKGTDHKGQGRCYQHGGSTPVKTGLYSKIQRRRVQDIKEELKAGGADPFDLVEESLLVKALTSYFLENWEDLTDALLRWNALEEVLAEQEERKPRPQRIPDIKDVTQLAETISRIVERAVKVRSQSALTMESFSRTVVAMAEVVAKVLAKYEVPEAAEEITDLWMRMQVVGK